MNVEEFESNPEEERDNKDNQGSQQASITDSENDVSIINKKPGDENADDQQKIQEDYMKQQQKKEKTPTEILEDWLSNEEIPQLNKLKRETQFRLSIEFFRADANLDNFFAFILDPMSYPCGAIVITLRGRMKWRGGFLGYFWGGIYFGLFLGGIFFLVNFWGGIYWLVNLDRAGFIVWLIWMGRDLFWVIF